MIRIITTHNILKGCFLFSCADISFLKNRSPKAFNLVQNMAILLLLSYFSNYSFNRANKNANQTADWSALRSELPRPILGNPVESDHG